MNKKVTIVGAGLVGSLCAIYMSKRGYQVSVFERRKDLRSEIISAGKSINLALSKRGWTALKKVNADQEVEKISIPMYKRIMHDIHGNLTEQQYGKEGQSIYSVSRAELNVIMMDLAEKNGAKLHFNEKCIDINFNGLSAKFENSNTKNKSEIETDTIIGADGTYSAIRDAMIDKMDHEINIKYIDHKYKEIVLPSDKKGNHLLDKNALHIWPRGNFMLIALANLDGSFTCTLFAAEKGKNSFENLNTEQEVTEYFKKVFPDFTSLVPDLYEQWKINPTSSLSIVKTSPWNVKDQVLLIGDAAHATVPFYGQGMNCGFEDCRILDDILEKNHDNLGSSFEEFNQKRKKEADGVQDLSMHNFIVMRDKTADPKFLLQKKIENKFSELYPEKWTPLYSMVSFTNVSYSKAWDIGMKQESIMKTIMSIPNIENIWESDKIMSKINNLL